MSDKNYYAILGVSRTATQNEIKKSYHKLALIWMTDKWKKILKERGFECNEGKCSIVPAGKTEPWFHSDKCREVFQEVDKKWKEITNAYDILSDSEKRKAYDGRGSSLLPVLELAAQEQILLLAVMQPLLNLKKILLMRYEDEQLKEQKIF